MKKDSWHILEMARVKNKKHAQAISSGVARGGGHGRMSPPVRIFFSKFVMIKRVKARIDPPRQE